MEQEEIYRAIKLKISNFSSDLELLNELSIAKVWHSYMFLFVMGIYVFR